MSARKKERRSPRTLKQRVEQIFSLINSSTEPIAKSRFKDIGLSSTAADSWLELITFIQSQNRIQLFKTGNYTFVDKQMVVDKIASNKYLRLCWNNFLNPKLPSNKRLDYLKDFGTAYLHLERSKDGVWEADKEYLDNKKMNELRELDKKRRESTSR